MLQKLVIKMIKHIDGNLRCLNFSKDNGSYCHDTSASMTWVQACRVCSSWYGCFFCNTNATWKQGWLPNLRILCGIQCLGNDYYKFNINVKYGEQESIYTKTTYLEDIKDISETAYKNGYDYKTKYYYVYKGIE